MLLHGLYWPVMTDTSGRCARECANIQGETHGQHAHPCICLLTWVLPKWPTPRPTPHARRPNTFGHKRNRHMDGLDVRLATPRGHTPGAALGLKTLRQVIAQKPQRLRTVAEAIARLCAHFGHRLCLRVGHEDGIVAKA